MKINRVINVSYIKTDGNVLDIAERGSSIVSDIVFERNRASLADLNKGFIQWGDKEGKVEYLAYDYALAFFSINAIINKNKLVKLIRKVRDMLREDGRLMIWDYNSTGYDLITNLRLKVIIGDDISKNVRKRIIYNPFRPKFSNILKLLDREGFEVSNSRITDDVYFIEAVRRRESGEFK